MRDEITHEIALALLEGRLAGVTPSVVRAFIKRYFATYAGPHGPLSLEKPLNEDQDPDILGDILPAPTAIQDGEGPDPVRQYREAQMFLGYCNAKEAAFLLAISRGEGLSETRARFRRTKAW